ncbi:hypothetical protein UNDYM_2306 [Undibacterium sp. YM2]|uniref:hypothetical protein n=1 Tax=Undibacterium sp. YM2 TaxID=2058625 RepID=UPI001331E735|nr:hypothetical protein [Undibacterium sp. YM2]BBB66559.1 hypothetical protein UNDYM_2306 [Undibacterium sp. YM2]
MTANLFFTLFNFILILISIILFTPLFMARKLAELELSLRARPLLGRTTAMPGSRSYLQPSAFFLISFIAYLFFAFGGEAEVDMEAAMFSSFILFLISMARVWKLRHLLGKPVCRSTLSSSLGTDAHRQNLYSGTDESAPAADSEAFLMEEDFDPMPVEQGLSCPWCGSHQVQIRNYAKKAGGAIGTVAGVTAGAVSFFGGAEVGAVTGAAAGPVGIVIGSIAGAIIGGLVGGATGCSVGVRLGAVLDDRILDNYECQECGHTYSQEVY